MVKQQQIVAIENTRTLAFYENSRFGEGLLELASSKTRKFGTDKTVLSFILHVELASSTHFDLESFIVLLLSCQWVFCQGPVCRWP